MFGVVSSLHPMHVEIAGFEINLLPPQGHEFGSAQSMAKHHQNNRCIAHPMAPEFTRCLHHGVHLVWSKILAHGGVMLQFPGGAWTRLEFRLCRKRTLARGR
jgi:hypothetical protein